MLPLNNIGDRRQVCQSLCGAPSRTHASFGIRATNWLRRPVLAPRTSHPPVNHPQAFNGPTLRRILWATGQRLCWESGSFPPWDAEGE